MKRAYLGVILILVYMVGTAVGREIGGVDLPDSLQAGNTQLLFNGGGKRTRFGMVVYIGSLYLQSRSCDPGKIMEADESMAIELRITSGLITSEKMESATREGFNNSLGGKTASLESEIEDFIGVFKDRIQKGDFYTFVYSPGKGTEIYKNGNLSRVIEGLEFKKALFGIWLCEKPAQASLRKDMLGL